MIAHIHLQCIFSYTVLANHDRVDHISKYSDNAILAAGKESRVILACLYRTSGRFYMLEPISVDSTLKKKVEPKWLHTRAVLEI